VQSIWQAGTRRRRRDRRVLQRKLRRDVPDVRKDRRERKKRASTLPAPEKRGSEPIKWNFTKFLVNREGEVVERYGSTTKPEQIEADIESALG